MYFKRSVFFVLYSIVNFYIGFRILKLLNYFTCNVNQYIYWVLFVVIAYSFIFERVKYGIFPFMVDKILYVIGGYWLGILMYGSIASVIGGILRLVLHGSTYGSEIIRIFDISVSAAVIFILFIGTYNAKSIKVSKYNLLVNKKVSAMGRLNIVMISDIHLGRMVGKKNLAKMVGKINELKPDVLILAGDVVDDDMDMNSALDILSPFKNIKSKYGIYSVYGNHEYIGSNTKKLKSIYEKLGINILEDDIKIIDNSFYIVGRDDKYSEMYKQKERKKVEQLLKGLDLKKPVILVDHQPLDLENSKRCGVDIQLSGHTHKGQLSPNNIITRRVFKIDYGHLKQENFNCIVSSGIGTWGPPLRIGSKSEIVEVIVEFE